MTDLADQIDALLALNAKGTVSHPIPGLAVELLERSRNALSEATDLIERLEGERDEARQIVHDIHWMAVRYADGRKTYAPSMCNDALRKAYEGGWLLYADRQYSSDPQYARDGDGPEWRSIEARAEDAEARLSQAEEVLRPFASVARLFEHLDDDGGSVLVNVSLGSLRVARSFLSSKESGNG